MDDGPCRLPRSAGGTGACTPLPDARPTPPGGRHQGKEIFSCMTPLVHFRELLPYYIVTSQTSREVGKDWEGKSTLKKWYCPEYGLKARIGISDDPMLRHNTCEKPEGGPVFLVPGDLYVVKKRKLLLF